MPARPTRTQRAPPIVAFAVFAVVMGTASLLRFWTFHSRSLDMAYYVRLVWGLAHGFYDQPVVGAPHVLGLHLEPVLFLFAGLARLGPPIAETLLVAQTLFAAAVIFPAHALAQRRLAPLVGERWAFVAALSIYLVPTVTRCVDYDVHPSTMALFPLMGLVNAIDLGAWKKTWLWLAAALLFREDVGLQAACLALTFVVWPREPSDRGRAALLAAAGLVWFFGYTLAVQPHYLPPRGSLDLHFAAFGGGRGGVGGLVASALTHPGLFVAHLLTLDRLLYPVFLLVPLALLPLFAPRFLAGALPLIAFNMLSDVPGVRAWQAHYITAAAPFLVGAALCGAARLATRVPPVWRRPIPLALATTGAICWFLRGAAPGSPEFSFAAYRDDAHARSARQLVAATGPDAVVVAPSPVLAHLAERPRVYHPSFAPPGAQPD